MHPTNRQGTTLTFERCVNCLFWLWPEDGKWHSLEPKLFRDAGGDVQMVRCPVCSRGSM